MTTLKEMIENKFEFDAGLAEQGTTTELVSYCSIDEEIAFILGAKYQHNQLKSELLPILLECTSMMQELRKYSRHNLSCDIKTMKAECDCGFAKIADEYIQALERLRKWSERSG